MAYQIDPESGDIIVNGFNSGIGESPYQGLTDVKNVNISSVPTEASVGFATTSVTANSISSAPASPLSTTTLSITVPSGTFFENNQAVTIPTTTVSGLTTGTYVYYVRSASAVSATSEQISLGLQYGGVDTISFGTTGTLTVSSVDMSLGPRGSLNKNYIQESNAAIGTNYHWLADSKGRVWSDRVITNAPSNGGFAPPASKGAWTYTLNNCFDLARNGSVDTAAVGNGLVLFTTRGTNGIDQWLFVFRSQFIDYVKLMTDSVATAATSLSWVYGWKPSDGSTGNSSGYLTTSLLYSTAQLSHEAIVSPGGNGGFVNYCDAYNVGQFSQASLGTAFDPTTPSTYNWANFPVLPVNDVAQCLAYQNAQILIGGRNSYIYPWDLVSNFPSNPLILVPEYNIQNIITVQQNAFIFAGQRGRIYITNGSQADLWAKVPDHISGTVQPTLIWGGVAFNQDKLYFGIFQGSTSAGIATVSSSNKYGGIWAVDVNKRFVYLSNVLSTGLYSGYVSGLLGFTQKDNLTGYGLFATWYDSSTSQGVDTTVTNPYSGGQSVIVSDMMPIGTLLKPTTPLQFEYKLSTPLLGGESVQLLVGSSLSDYVNNTFVSAGTTSGSTGGTQISDNFSSPIQNQQWLLVKAIMTSTLTTGSLVRMTEMRIRGATTSSPSTKQYSID